MAGGCRLAGSSSRPCSQALASTVTHEQPPAQPASQPPYPKLPTPPTREADVAGELLDRQRLARQRGLVALRAGQGRGRRGRRRGGEGEQAGTRLGGRPRARDAGARPRPPARPTCSGVSSSGCPELPSSARILMSAGTMSPRLRGAGLGGTQWGWVGRQALGLGGKALGGAGRCRASHASGGLRLGRSPDDDDVSGHEIGGLNGGHRAVSQHLGLGRQRCGRWRRGQGWVASARG